MLFHEVLNNVFGFYVVVSHGSFTNEGRDGVFAIFINRVNDDASLYAAAVDAGEHLGNFAMVHHFVKQLKRYCLFKVQELRNQRKHLRFEHFLRKLLYAGHFQDGGLIQFNIQ